MKKVISLLFVLSTVTIFGGTKITLENSLNLAYEKNYEYQNEKLQKLNMDLKVREGYKSAGPHLDYMGTYNISEKDNPLPTHRGKMVNRRMSNEFSITQPIYNGGVVFHGIVIARKAQTMEGYKLEQEKSNLKLKVTRAYMDLITAKESIKIYEDSLKEVEATLKKIERKYELNMISKANYLPLKARVISTRAQLLSAKNNYKIKELQFKNLVGMEVEGDLEVADIPESKYDLALIDIESDTSYAMENNKDSEMLKLKTEIDEEQEKISRADLLPKVNARFSVNANDEKIRKSGDKWYWLAGVTVNWRIFDFGKSFDSLERARNNTRIAKQAEKQAREGLEVKIRSNYINLVRLNSMVEAKEVELEANEESFRLQKAKYDKGMTTLNDYLDYEKRLNQSRLDLLTAKLDYDYAFEKYNEDLK